MNNINSLNGVNAYGVKTPLIQIGDNLKEIVFDSVMKRTKGEIHSKSIIAITEAVVAMSQNNIISADTMAKEISKMYPDTSRLVIVDPIQSRNRFSDVLMAIAMAKTLKQIDIVFTCPTDEVGNSLLDEEKLDNAGFDFTNDILTEEEFEKSFGRPSHPFTQIDYIKLYKDIIKKLGKEVNIYLCTPYTFKKLPKYLNCNDFLVASIHRKKLTRKRLENGGAKHVYDLGDICKEPSLDCVAYNPDYGCYGTNKMDDGVFKLLPRNCEQFVNEIKELFKERTGIDVEVMIYGDGAFKDPVGGIWELADPVVSLAHTSGLNGKPKEVKIKYLVAQNKNKTPEEQAKIIADALAERKSNDDETTILAQGTTPRRISDLVGSLCDLISGSGKRQTPIVIIENYLD